MKEATSIIPIELLIEIFCKLPSKSLLRFKSISKSIHEIITDPYFVTKHLKSATNRSGYLIHHGYLAERLTPLGPNFSISDKNLLQQLRSAGLLDRHYSINCSYGGLLCLSNLLNSSSDLCLWNPSLGIIKKIPNATWMYPLHTTRLCGLGFDKASNDYKVLQILKHRSFRNLCGYRSRVYSLRANQWRWIHYEFSSTLGFDENFGTSCGDGFYFVASYEVGGDDGKRRRSVIMSFSFSDKTFREISLPTNICDKRRGRVDTGSINDSLALMVEYESGIDVWVLNEGVGIRSWNKLCEIDTGCGLNFFSFGLDGKVLLVKKKFKFRKELVCWDLGKREFKATGFEDDSFCSCFTYSESLLLLGDH